MARRKIGLSDNIRRVIRLPADATDGAVVGVNLFLQDGTLVTEVMLFGDPDAPQDPDFTYWKLIQEIPANIVALAALTGSGFAYRDVDGTWRLRKVGRQVIGFAYGDAPTVIYTPAVDAVMTLCRVIFDTPFDGAGASVQIGSNADHDLLMPAALNAPDTAAAFETAPDVMVPAGTDLLAFITPGAGASAGAGRIVLDSIPVEGI